MIFLHLNTQNPNPLFSKPIKKKEKKMFKIRVLEIEGVKYGTCVADDDVLEKVVILLSTRWKESTKIYNKQIKIWEQAWRWRVDISPLTLGNDLV